MFEKEAFEEWKSEQYKDQSTEERLEFVEHLHTFPKYFEKAFKDGAEYGYNKANEWHYVKDKLPPIKKEYNGRSELVLVLSKEKEMQYAQYVEKEKTWARGIFEINFVPYAWKEIVLPKEVEE